MNVLIQKSVFQTIAYDNHRRQVDNVSFIPNPELRAFFSKYLVLLNNLPIQTTYCIRETPDAGIIVADTGNLLELPKSLFHPVFDLSKRKLLYGELVSWIEFLKENK